MSRILRWGVLLTLAVCLFTPDISAQRRTRPGSMKHSASEVTDRTQKKNIRCRYICNGATFQGPIYQVVDYGGGVKIGDAVIFFGDDRFHLSFDAAKFKVQQKDRKNSWKYEKIGEDFNYEGKFATIEQYGQKWLILYDGDSDNVFAKIPIESTDAQEFELSEDGMLIKLSIFSFHPY